MRASGQKKYKRSSLIRLLISYSLGIMLLIGGIGLTVNHRVSNEFTARLETESMKSLEHMGGLMDATWSNLQHISNSITLNARLTPYHVKYGGYESYQAAKELTRYLESCNLLFDIGVCYQESGSIFTSNGAYDTEYYFSRLYSRDGFESDDFLSICEELTAPVFFDFSGVTVNKVTYDDFVMCVYPIPIYNMAPNGTVLFLIRRADMDGMLKAATVGCGSSAFITDPEGRVLLSLEGGSGPEGLRSIKDAMPRLTEGVNEVAAPEETYKVFSLASRYGNLRYVSAEPLSQYLSPLDNVRRGFLLALLAVSALGLAAALIMAWRSYRPIRMLADFFTADAPGSPEQKLPGELEWITSNLEDMRSKNARLQRSVSSGQEIARQRELFHLVTRGLPQAAEGSPANSPFPWPCFRVLILEYEQAEGLRDAGDPWPDAAVPDFFRECGQVYAVETSVDNMLCLLLNYGDPGRDKERIAGALRAFRRTLSGQEGCFITSGIGAVKTDPAEIHLSYKEAIKCLRFKKLKGAGKDIFYGEVHRELDYNMDFLTVCCGNLEEALKSADSAGAARALDSVLQLLETDLNDPSMIPYASFSIFQRMQSIAERFHLASAYSPVLKGILIDERLTLPEIHRRYTAVSMDICGSIQALLHRQESGLKEKLMEYVSVHYPEQDLTLEKAAADFGLSPSYLTRYARQQLGEPLMKYIDHVRMEKARYLLKSTSHKLSGILLQCGYVDKDNFCRKFKRTEGVTPMQFRKLCREGQGQTISS